MSTGQDRGPLESHSPNRILFITVGVLFLVAIIVSIFSATKTDVVLDPNTPAGVVQLYLKSALDGNYEKAATYLASGSPCAVQDLDRAYIAESTRVDLVDSKIEEMSAQVRIRIEIATGGPFDNFMTEVHTLRLTFSSGKWSLNGIPWPLYNCELVKK